MSCEKCGREIKNYGVFLGGMRCPNYCDKREAMTKKKTKLAKAYANMFGRPGGAVFNGHINHADKRARDLMRVVCPDMLEELEAIEGQENGIMGIFSRERTPAIAAYVMLVNAFVLEA
jgi:hypothetical protein